VRFQSILDASADKGNVMPENLCSALKGRDRVPKDGVGIRRMPALPKGID
jgi:hypothetical protein